MPRIRAEPLASVPVEETSSDGASWLSCADVGGAAILQRIGRDRGDGDRHVLKDLGAALGGDDDVGVAVGRAVGRRDVGFGIDLARFPVGLGSPVGLV